jgi:hypothetical protein
MSRARASASLRERGGGSRGRGRACQQGALQPGRALSARDRIGEVSRERRAPAKRAKKHLSRRFSRFAGHPCHAPLGTRPHRGADGARRAASRCIVVARTRGQRGVAQRPRPPAPGWSGRAATQEASRLGPAATDPVHDAALVRRFGWRGDLDAERECLPGSAKLLRAIAERLPDRLEDGYGALRPSPRAASRRDIGMMKGAAIGGLAAKATEAFGRRRNASSQPLDRLATSRVSRARPPHPPCRPSQAGPDLSEAPSLLPGVRDDDTSLPLQ